MKKQVVIIHGGDSFERYENFLDSLKNWEVSIESFFSKSDWKSNLAAKIGGEYEVFFPRMPNKQNAKYAEWKIWFERMLPFLRDKVILIGHSLGGLFLVKYLSENNFPAKISALFLVAAPHGRTKDIGSFQLTGNLQKICEQCQDIHIFQSEDDQIVPPGEAKSYKRVWPKAKLHMFQGRGHFHRGDFPELLEKIKKFKLDKKRA